MWLGLLVVAAVTSSAGVPPEGRDDVDFGGWAFAAPSKLSGKVDRLVKASQRAMQRGDHAEVERKLAVALRLDPNRADVAFGRGIALSFMADDLAASQMLRLTLRLRPDHVQARDALSMLEAKMAQSIEHPPEPSIEQPVAEHAEVAAAARPREQQPLYSIGSAVQGAFHEPSGAVRWYDGRVVANDGCAITACAVTVRFDADGTEETYALPDDRDALRWANSKQHTQLPCCYRCRLHTFLRTWL